MLYNADVTIVELRHGEVSEESSFRGTKVGDSHALGFDSGTLQTFAQTGHNKEHLNIDFKNLD